MENRKTSLFASWLKKNVPTRVTKKTPKRDKSYPKIKDSKNIYKKVAGRTRMDIGLYHMASRSTRIQDSFSTILVNDNFRCSFLITCFFG